MSIFPANVDSITRQFEVSTLTFSQPERVKVRQGQHIGLVYDAPVPLDQAHKHQFPHIPWLDDSILSSFPYEGQTKKWSLFFDCDDDGVRTLEDGLDPGWSFKVLPCYQKLRN